MSKKAKESELPIVDFTAVDEKPRFRSHYDDRQKELSEKNALGQVGEQMTKQAFKEESDINNILRKYNVTGVLPDTARAALAHFGDFSTVPTYKESLELVMRAQEMFSDLPAAVRNRFANDPGELLAFLSDSGNRDEAISLGLVDPATGKPPLPSVEAQEPTSTKSKGKPATPAPAPSEGE